MMVKGAGGMRTKIPADSESFPLSGGRIRSVVILLSL